MSVEPVTRDPGAPAQRGLVLVLAAGCVWFGVLALGRTRRMAEILGMRPAAVRALGIRDLASAATLVGSRDPRPALRARLACDVADASVLARRRPLMALVALAYACLDVVALRAGGRRRDGADTPSGRA